VDGKEVQGAAAVILPLIRPRPATSIIYTSDLKKEFPEMPPSTLYYALGVIRKQGLLTDGGEGVWIRTAA
jgi:hypothetical protein